MKYKNLIFRIFINSLMRNVKQAQNREIMANYVLSFKTKMILFSLKSYREKKILLAKN